MRALGVCVAALLLAGACQSAPVAIPFITPQVQPGICQGEGVTVDIDFPAAGRHDCVIAPDGSVIVSVDHEPAVVEGINPSPWFAFRVRAEAARTATFTLDYTDYTHRYAPQISHDGRSWSALAAGSVTLNERRTRATLKVELPEGVTWIAAQPLSPAEDNISWTRNTLSGRGFEEKRYGKSLEGRDLVGFVGGGGIDAIVILTRQHPPETTGQEAYRGFLERLVRRNDAIGATFRGRHRIILAPMPNPDGVEGGFWRLNAGGVDLNRDWTALTQPETRVLATWIRSEAGTRRVVAMMDFHSTDKTVIYAPPLTSPSPTIDFLPALKSAFDARLTPPPEWSYSHRSDSGNAKSWALEALKAPGITVELADQVSAGDARALGAAAADALMEYFGD